MITEIEIALFDDYITNSLSGEALADFENKLASDSGFKSKFERYKSEFNEISDAAELSDFRKQLKAIHQAIYPKTKVFFLRPKFLAITGVAAIIAIVVFTIPNGLTESGDASYNELSYASDDNADMAMEETTSVEYDSIDEVGEYNVEEELTKDEFINNHPLGTAFLIDLNGYLITSKHLIKKQKFISLQQREDSLTFEAEVIYTDTILDFALLKADPAYFENLDKIPYRIHKEELELGDEVFTLGYTKKDIVYTKGDVSSRSGYKGDKNYIEVSMPSNPGNSGAPLFNASGELVGVITANNSKKQSVTYSINHIILNERLGSLQDAGFEFTLSSKSPYLFKYRKNLIKKLKPYIFEVH